MEQTQHVEGVLNLMDQLKHSEVPISRNEINNVVSKEDVITKT